MSLLYKELLCKFIEPRNISSVDLGELYSVNITANQLPNEKLVIGFITHQRLRQVANDGTL